MLSAGQVITAVAVGAVGCLLIWLTAPYNNFLLGNSYITDSYLPVGAIAYLLALMFVVNPLLRLTWPALVLSRRQLALILAMLLISTVVPGQGVMRTLPYSLTRSNQQINQTPTLSHAIEQTHINRSIFPDPIGAYVDTPVSDQFQDEVGPDSSIAWDTWGSLALVWGTFVLAAWLMMVGVGLAMFPEWRDRERLQFPLLTVYQCLLPDRQRGHVLPEIFRSYLFWIGAGTVMFIYLIKGLHHHTNGSFPDFPLGWNLTSYFTEEPWRHLSRWVKRVGKVYFILVGIAYFMPNRVSFSIWFFAIAYAIYEMVQQAYFPPYARGVIWDHRNGSFVAVTLVTLYISRRHWLQVGRLMFRRPLTDADRLLKMSGWMIALGALGVATWLVWAGVPPWWAIAFVALGFMASVIIARIVAETGLPFIAVDGMYTNYLLSLLPARLLTGATIYVAGFVTIIFQIGSRAGASALALHAVGVDEKATPRYQLRLGYLLIGVLVVGFVIGGIVHVHMASNHAQKLGRVSQPLVTWGAQRMGTSERHLVDFTRGSWSPPAERVGNFTFAFLAAGGMMLMCMYSASWPLHPIGMLVISTYYGSIAWVSVFIGWSIKRAIITYGGAGAFHRARPLFLGLIMGEVFSAVIWTLTPVILIMLGHDPADVGHISVLPR